MNSYNTILFDFDGTLMNTNEVIIQSWQHTFRMVEGKERPVEEIIRTFGEPLGITMGKVLPHIPVEEGVEIYRSFHRENFGDLIKLFPGVKELLSDLKQERYMLGLVTSRLAATTYEGMEKYGIQNYFDCIITADDTKKHKPDPEPLNIALERLDAGPKEALFIGDSMFDIHCARNAGVKSVLVGWALAVTEEEKSGPQGPDYVIQRTDDLWNLLSDNISTLYR